MSGDMLIARVVADLRAGRVQAQSNDRAMASIHKLTAGGPVINASAIWQSIVNRDEINAYDDNPCIAPPWDVATICYVNSHGNANVMVLAAYDRQRGEDIPEWETDNDVRWNEVRWVIAVAVYVGGLSDTMKRRIPTSGPMICYTWAVYETGEPADLHWVDVGELGEDIEVFNYCMLTVLATLNFMNCRNVELVDASPTMPRPERRQVNRTGVRLSVLNVYPAGVTTRGRDGQPLKVGVPLTSVHGHFARYGVEGRGLLFGKYAGRFWIPQHARGKKELGENVNDYDLKPEVTS